jgi:predicted O-methyltransferase YrrM
LSEVLADPVESYLNELLPARDAVLQEMERYAAQHNVPIVGPACGRVLHQLAHLSGARRVFEMGSAIGYSTLWLARAVGPKGVVFYTDSDPENTRRAEAYLKRARVLQRVRLLTGDAIELLRSTKAEFDLIFNDVNKDQYPKVLRLAVPRLRVGGLFVTDNVLWSGRVARTPASNDAETRAIQEFNRLLYTSPKLFTTVIPLRDGLAVSERLR